MLTSVDRSRQDRQFFINSNVVDFTASLYCKTEFCNNPSSFGAFRFCKDDFLREQGKKSAYLLFLPEIKLSALLLLSSHFSVSHACKWYDMYKVYP